jgi:hypothetical protein
MPQQFIWVPTWRRRGNGVSVPPDKIIALNRCGETVCECLAMPMYDKSSGKLENTCHIGELFGGKGMGCP